MSTSLELAQDLARESGTMSGVVPTAFTGQTGRTLKCVQWTVEAWRRIQNKRDGWFWMEAEFTAPTVSGTAKYDPVTATGWELTRWAMPRHDDSVMRPLSIYLTATGVSDEGEMREIGFREWFRKYGRGSQDNARPSEWAWSPNNQICLGPTPDAVYTVHGLYRKTPQVFADGTETPEMPARFHQAIVWQAAALLQEHDEADWRFVRAHEQLTQIMDDLDRDQLPTMVWGGTPLEDY